MLEEAGAEILVDNREIAVVGFVEGLQQVKLLFDGWRRIKRHIIHDRPDVVVLIDYPDFNFMVARLAKRHGVRVFYYITPQVWAWRSRRVRTLERITDEMAVILPFEPEFYAKHGVKVHYVGHPLLDVMSSAPSVQEAREHYHATRSASCVGLLPGSRHGEIRMLLPLLLKTAAILSQSLPRVSFLLPVAPTLHKEMIEEEVHRCGLPVRVVRGDTYGVIRACDLVITASGTVTLESAILGTPMILVYKLPGLSYRIGRRLVRVKHAGLPNLIAGRSIVPEFIQEDANEHKVAAEAMRYLSDGARLEQQRRDLAEIRPLLGSPGVADRVAGLIVEAGVRRKASGVRCKV